MENEAHRRLLVREGLASALYVALVVLATLVAVPDERLPSDEALLRLVVGGALGLVLAHWVAFRLAARITTAEGEWTPTAAAEGGAQVLGGVGVAVVASVPYLLLDGEAALQTSLTVLVGLLALAGLLIARLQGRSWLATLVSTLGTLVVLLAVVLVKNALGH